MSILFRFFIFIESLSLNTKKTNEALMSAHNDLLVRSGVVHESDRLWRDFLGSIDVCRQLSWLKAVLLVHVFCYSDVLILIRIRVLKVDLRHLCTVPLNKPIFHGYYHMLLS